MVKACTGGEEAKTLWLGYVADEPLNPDEPSENHNHPEN